MIRFTFLLWALFALSTQTGAHAAEMALIKGAEYQPLYGNKENLLTTVKDFYLDVAPVTHSQFLSFVQSESSWQKSKVKKLFAEKSYLQDWTADEVVPESLLNAPVTSVSWFAAKAYCQKFGKRLPTVDEWEYAGMASKELIDARTDESFIGVILRGYETPKTYLKAVKQSEPNYWGVYDLHGLVWEWVSDFNSVIISGESRNDSDKGLFCAAGAAGASDLMNYAAFMRYAFRASLKANFTVRNLGFRCASDVKI